MYDYDIITIEQFIDGIIVTFHVKKINILNSKEIETLLLDYMDEVNQDIILDLSNVLFIDSSGFGMLHKLKIKSYINKVNVEYLNINDELEDLFNFIGFN